MTSSRILIVETMFASQACFLKSLQGTIFNPRT